MSGAATLVEQRGLGGGIFLLRLRAPSIARAARPGQFMMLRVSQGLEPLLPRPFSIHGVEGDVVLLLYRVVGKGTALLSQAGPGTEQTAWGPLGRGFNLSPQRPLLVAGGMGAAPLGLAAQALTQGGVAPRMLLGLAGARDWEGLLARARELVPDLELASEDGSLGHRGLVTDLLGPALAAGAHDGVLACGPMGMLKAVATLCAQRAIPCQVSLEAPMACGVGACLGCAIPIPGGGYARACQEGPVFDASAVDWGRV